MLFSNSHSLLPTFYRATTGYRTKITRPPDGLTTRTMTIPSAPLPTEVVPVLYIVPPYPPPPVPRTASVAAIFSVALTLIATEPPPPRPPALDMLCELMIPPAPPPAYQSSSPVMSQDRPSPPLPGFVAALLSFPAAPAPPPPPPRLSVPPSLCPFASPPRWPSAPYRAFPPMPVLSP